MVYFLRLNLIRKNKIKYLNLIWFIIKLIGSGIIRRRGKNIEWYLRYFISKWIKWWIWIEVIIKVNKKIMETLKIGGIILR